METEVVRASEMREKVFQRITDIRFGPRYREELKQYEKDLRAYEKKRGKREEITLERDETYDYGGQFQLKTGKKNQARGFYTMAKGKPTFHRRPEEPRPWRGNVWTYSSRQVIGNKVFPARHGGLLADATYNREIRPDRVEKYALEMEAGKWQDLLSDPISITTEGQVLNGQHRLAAVADADGFGDTDPAFLIIWGVDPQEALYADGSHRTAHDEKTIAVKLVKRRAA